MKFRSIVLPAVGLSLSYSALAFDGDLELGIFQLNRGEFHAAIAEFEPLLAESYAPAQYQMALVHLNGWGVKKDKQKAFELMSLAAAQNYPDALFDLAQMYTTGDIVKQDLAAAFSLTEKAANKGLVGAQYNLGVMYHNGEGTVRNDQRAASWYKKAAEQNYALAQFNLALMYFEGHGVKKDVEKSYFWNLIAAKNGYADASKSSELDERNLSVEQITTIQENAYEKHQRIIDQVEMKAKMSQKKSQF